MHTWLKAHLRRWLTPSAKRYSPVEVDDLFVSFDSAVAEIERRNNTDTTLRARVEEYLGEGMPDYFRNGPLVYMARHIATPSFETLRFLHLVEPTGMKAVIGQDTHDRFVSHNPLKRALVKLPICIRIGQKGGQYTEQYQKVSIADTNSANGTPLAEIQTLWGESLITFHNQMLRTLARSEFDIEDDASWIDVLHRGNLLEHYKKFLALFLVHGIMFEDYLIEDEHESKFVVDVLRPAFEFIEKHFGYRPLVVRLTPTTVESVDYWMSYPHEVLDIVHKKLNL